MTGHENFQIVSGFDKLKIEIGSWESTIFIKSHDPDPGHTIVFHFNINRKCTINIWNERSWTQDRTLESWKLWTYIINVMIRELLFPWLYKIFNLFDPFSFCWCQLCWFQRFLWLGCYGVYHLGKTMVCLNFCLKIVMSKWERRFYTVEKFW